jgi:hypothetical protein
MRRRCLTSSLYKIGPFVSYDFFNEPVSFLSFNMSPFVKSPFDRQIHHFDQMLHHEAPKEWEDRFKMEMKDRLHLLTPETVLAAIKSKRDAFIHVDQLLFEPSHPFVLRHGDFHGRDVLVR